MKRENSNYKWEWNFLYTAWGKHIFRRSIHGYTEFSIFRSFGYFKTNFCIHRSVDACMQPRLPTISKPFDSPSSPIFDREKRAWISASDYRLQERNNDSFVNLDNAYWPEWCTTTILRSAKDFIKRNHVARATCSYVRSTRVHLYQHRLNCSWAEHSYSPFLLLLLDRRTFYMVFRYGLRLIFFIL